jgi:hypothetical protein
LNFPCKYLEKLEGLPVYLPLYNRSGLNCSIERSGIIRPRERSSFFMIPGWNARKHCPSDRFLRRRCFCAADNEFIGYFL